MTTSTVPAPAVPATEDRPDALAELATVLDEWATRHGVSTGYAAALARVAANGFGLHDRPDPWLAHLLHASLRSSVATDGASPREYMVLSAPDLRVSDPDGRLGDAERRALPTETRSPGRAGRAPALPPRCAVLRPGADVAGVAGSAAR
jgi:hypothetical protein